MKRIYQETAVVAALAIAIAACGARDAAPATTSPEEASSTAIVADGCTLTSEARDETVTIESGGMERSYIVVAPESADPLPVVLAYHGFTKTADDHRVMTGFADAAVEQGFIAVFPQGTIPEDGTRPYHNINTNDDDTLADDIDFTETILDQLQAEHCVDSTRVYATGWSNGGMMASTLACQLESRFAAVAAVSGVTLRDDCPDRPVPIMILHGTADDLIPYDGAEPGDLAEVSVQLGANEAQSAMFGGVMLNPADYIDMWIEHNGCQGDPVISEEGVGLQVSDYSGCEVEVIIADGGGHRWPRYPTQRILDFFFENR